MMSPRQISSFFAILALSAGPAQTAWAESAGLQRGREALLAGHAAQAVKLLSTEILSPGLSPEDRARTLYFRAKAYYATQQPALAMADEGAALWLGKLTAAEAADAEQLKARAQQSAMGDQKLPAVTTLINRPPPPDAPPVKAAVAEPTPAPKALSMKSAVAPTPLAAPGVAKPAAASQAALAPPAPVPPASIPVRQAAPTWSAAAVQHEELAPPVPPARPAHAWITNAALAEPDAPPPLETGSITRTDQPAAQPGPAPTPSTQLIAPAAVQATIQAAVVPPAPLPAAVAVKGLEPAAGLSAPGVPSAPSVDAASAPKLMAASLVPDLTSLGGLFKPQPSPVAADVERATEFQRSYAERIRRINAERAANPKVNAEN